MVTSSRFRLVALSRMLRPLLGTLAFIATTIHGMTVEELAQIHVEAIGGRERIHALRSLRATGYVVVAGQRMHFTMTAARPDRIRLETTAGGRSLVQGSDGRNPAWEFDTGDWPPKYRQMAPGLAKTFVADAEFDDPLVSGAERGYTLEYAGEVDVAGQRLLRVLVTRKLAETFSLLLDPETYLIVRRVEERHSPLGEKVVVATHFNDYRPVNGVLVPHRIALYAGESLRQETLISAIQANPEVTEETFSRPQVGGRAKK